MSKRILMSPRVLVALGASLLALAGARADTPGQTTFNTVCTACHGQGGVGIPGLAPALAGALGPQLASPQGKTYLASVLLGGLSGSIESQGKKFNSAMPNLGLSDQQVVDVLAHVVGELNPAPKGWSVTVEEVAAVRATQPTPAKTHALRKAMLAPAK